jgi:fumarylacetoacetate (FAA) hydrolase
MKLLTYLRDGNEQLACFIDGHVYDLEDLHPDLPNSMSVLLNYWEDLFPAAQEAEKAVKNGRIAKGRGAPTEGLKLMAPVPFPTSCRDGYAFKQHVAAARRQSKGRNDPGI